MKSLGIVLILGITLFGCTAKALVDRPAVSCRVDRVDQGLEVLHAALAVTEQGPVIKGAIRNNSPLVYSYAEVDITLIDPSGRPIAPARARINDLSSGTIWYWTLPLACDNVADFAIVRVLAR